MVPHGVPHASVKVTTPLSYPVHSRGLSDASPGTVNSSVLQYSSPSKFLPAGVKYAENL